MAQDDDEFLLHNIGLIFGTINTSVAPTRIAGDQGFKIRPHLQAGRVSLERPSLTSSIPC